MAYLKPKFLPKGKIAVLSGIHRHRTAIARMIHAGVLYELHATKGWRKIGRLANYALG